MDMEKTKTNKNFIEIEVGGIVSFGGYEWLVLDVQEGRALVMSEKVLEQRPYNEEYASVTWETCSLRKYLNGDFLDKFSDEDKARIVETTIINNDIIGRADGGNATNDKIFILSSNEVKRYFGDGGLGILKKFSDDTKGETIYVDVLGWWWLRSPSYTTNLGAMLYRADKDYVDATGMIVEDYCGIRPAMWLKLGD